MSGLQSGFGFADSLSLGSNPDTDQKDLPSFSVSGLLLLGLAMTGVALGVRWRSTRSVG